MRGYAERYAGKEMRAADAKAEKAIQALAEHRAENSDEQIKALIEAHNNTLDECKNAVSIEKKGRRVANEQIAEAVDIIAGMQLTIDELRDAAPPDTAEGDTDA